MCCDTFNYDPARELWCPLAVGLDVPRLAKLDKTQKRDNAWGKTLITEIGRTTNPGFTLNPVSGIPGAFFRDHRERDIVATCEHILQERFQIRIAA